MTQKGFTLIELLVVVAIIGILAAVGIVAFNGFINNTRTQAVISQHNNIVLFIKTEKAKCELGKGNEVQQLVTAASLNGTPHRTEPPCVDFLNPVQIFNNAYKMQQHLIGVGFKNVLEPSFTFHDYSGGFCSSLGSMSPGCTDISGANGVMIITTYTVDGNSLIETINFN